MNTINQYGNPTINRMVMKLLSRLGPFERLMTGICGPLKGFSPHSVKGKNYWLVFGPSRRKLLRWRQQSVLMFDNKQKHRHRCLALVFFSHCFIISVMGLPSHAFGLRDPKKSTKAQDFWELSNHFGSGGKRRKSISRNINQNVDSSLEMLEENIFALKTRAAFGLIKLSFESRTNINICRIRMISPSARMREQLNEGRRVRQLKAFKAASCKMRA